MFLSAVDQWFRSTIDFTETFSVRGATIWPSAAGVRDVDFQTAPQLGRHTKGFR